MFKALKADSMPLSAAEKQRRYRQRRDADPDRRQSFLEKERKRWHDRKGKLECTKQIEQLSDRQRRQKRKYWRKKQKDHRALQKTASNAITPPDTPDEYRFVVDAINRRDSTKRRRNAKINRRKEILSLRQALQQERRKSERYKKRYERIMGKKASDSPRSKTRKLLRNFHVDDKVKKTLTFHFALISDLRAKYKGTEHLKMKNLVARLLAGKIVKKYRLQKFSKLELGLTQRKWKHLKMNGNADPFALNRRRMHVAACKLRSMVESFYLRDDVSRLTAGKKETRTKKKKKMQKRYLNDSLKMLHTKFVSENPEVKISYSLFCRLRPFYVLIPSLKDRETCLCKLHENLNLLVGKLYDLKIVDTRDLCLMSDNSVCNKDSKVCMYGECSSCSENGIPVSEDYPLLQQAEYYQWVSKMIEDVKLGDAKLHRVTAKELLSGRLMDIVDEFQSQMKRFKRHLFNIRHQFQALKDLKENLGNNECIIQLDFAENYMCQYTAEIQSAHFGGSHKQATIHDVVIHVGKQNAISLCTISSSLQHDPPAIWQYLQPVFGFIRSNFPEVGILHFFSDGPSTQYRQRKNFFFFCTKIYEHGFKAGTWNFFEAGHGKGAPDGVGAAVKRSADRAVNHGADIPNAEEMFKVLSSQESHIKLFYTDAISVDQATTQLPQNIPTVPGTMSIHQIISMKPGIINYRGLSCFCNHNMSLHCECFAIREFAFPMAIVTEDPNGNQADVLEPLDVSDPSVVGKWCVVRYDGRFYPGTITTIDEEDVEVNCMAVIGKNRFFWPMIKDVVWYRHDNVICVISEPQKVGSRHVEIDKKTWSLLEDL